MKVLDFDKYIYYSLLLFAAITCVNHAIANNILAITVVLVLFRLKKQHVSANFPYIYKRALYVFFGVMFISIFISPDSVVSAKEFWRFANRMILFLVILFFVKKKNELIVLMGAFLCSLFINNISAVIHGLESVSRHEIYIRATGFETGPIILAGYLLLTLPVLTVLFFYIRKMVWKYGLGLIWLFGMLALLLNGTRAAWAILAILLPFSVLLVAKNKKKAGCTILLIVVVSAMVAGTMPSFRSRVASFTDFQQVSNLGHYYIMRDSWKMILDQPFRGVGLGRFQEVFNEKYRSPEHFLLEPNLTPHAHNNTLTIWAETGIIGCIAFWYMWISFLYGSAKDWYKKSSFPALMFCSVTLALILQGFTDYSFGLNQVIKIYFAFLAIYVNYQQVEDGNV